MATVIQTTMGDTSPQEAFTVTRSDNSVVDLTNATVNFKIENPITKMFTNTASSICAITDAAAGQCVYNWTSSGTDTPVVGIYNAYLIITFQNGTRETYPFLIEVAPAS